MARRPREEAEELFEASPDELDSVLAGLPSQDTVINLWRLQSQGPPSYVSEFAPSDFSLEAVKNTYGGGKYKIIAKNGGDVRASVFTVDGEPKTGMKPVYKRYINGKLVFAKPEDADVIVGETPRSLNIGSNGSDSNLTMMILAELKSLRETFSQSQQNPSNSKKDFLEEMMMFKNLFSPPQNPVQDFSKVAIDLIKQGMEVASMGEGGGSPWMMILDKVLPTIQETLKMVGIQQQRSQVIPMPNRAPAQTELPKPEVPLTGFDAIAGELQSYLPTFIRAASIGTDPNILIDMTIPNIQSGEMTNAVIVWLESDQWFIDLSKLHPAITAQAAWWGEYRQGLLEALKNPQGFDAQEE